MISLGAEGELGYPLKKCKELHATQNSSLSVCTEPVKGFNFENNASFQKSNITLVPTKVTGHFFV